MGRLDHLQVTLPGLAAQKDCRVHLVDYACPERCGDWASASFPEISVTRVRDQSIFHHSRSKNIGWRAVRTGWVCFVDADILLDRDFSHSIRAGLRPGNFYRGPTIGEGSVGTCVCHVDDLAAVGGFDERFRGWGDEDIDLYDALEFLGVRSQLLPAGLLHHLDHDNRDRMKHFVETTRERSLIVNRIYRLAKWDLARLNRRSLTPQQCDSLYKTVRPKVLAVLKTPDQAIELNASVIEPKLGPIRLDRTLVYRLTTDGPLRL